MQCNTRSVKTIHKLSLTKLKYSLSFGNQSKYYLSYEIIKLAVNHRTAIATGSCLFVCIIYYFIHSQQLPLAPLSVLEVPLKFTPSDVGHSNHSAEIAFNSIEVGRDVHLWNTVDYSLCRQSHSQALFLSLLEDKHSRTQTLLIIPKS
jgi:hypothetical protein